MGGAARYFRDSLFDSFASFLLDKQWDENVAVRLVWVSSVFTIRLKIPDPKI